MSFVPRVHKLSDAATTLALTAEVQDPVFDDAALSCTLVISTEDEDRSGDIVVAEGVDLVNHQKNPVVLYEHGEGGILVPVGKAEDAAGNYTVKKQAGRIVAGTFFHRQSPEGEQIYRLVKDKYLRGGSISFKPVKGHYRSGSRRDGMLWEAIELLEYSHVMIPDNQDSLVLAQEALGKSWLTSPTIRKSLERRIPDSARKTTVTVPEVPPMATPAATTETPVTTTTAAPAAAPVHKAADPGYVPLADNPHSSTLDSDDSPAGCKALGDMYSRYLDAAGAVEGHARKNEHPEVVGYLDDQASDLDDKCSKTASLHAKLYPDHDALDKDLGDDIGTGTGISDEEKKRLERWAGRQPANARIVKRLAALKKHRADELSQRLSKSAAVACKAAAAFLDELSTSEIALATAQKVGAKHYAQRLLELAANPADESEELKAVRVRCEKNEAQTRELSVQLKRALSGRR